MKVFISSVNSEPECNRAAAADAVRSLGHEAVLAEEFSASPDSPRRVCLAAARSADLVLLLMGAKYGAAQERGVSPTHEEYREAREHTPVLVFEQEGCQREPNQEAFYQEVRGWERGHVFNSFSGADTLRNAVTRAIHEHALRSEAGDVSPGDLIERATAVIPQRPRSEPGILVAVAGGPHQQLVRPAALEDARLRREFLAECLTGENAVLDPSSGTDTLVEDGSLLARAREGVGWVRLAEDGTIGISQDGIKNPRDGGFLLALIEEDVHASIGTALRLAARLLDRIDDAARISHVGIVAALLGASNFGWRTREEQAREPNRMEMNICPDRIIQHCRPAVHTRQTLSMDAERIAQDLLTLLRRCVRGPG